MTGGGGGGHGGGTKEVTKRRVGGGGTGGRVEWTEEMRKEMEDDKDMEEDGRKIKEEMEAEKKH